MLTNSPSQLQMWRLEARKSFSLGVQFVDSRELGIDVTGCTVTFVLAQPDWRGGAVVLTSDLGLVDPETGVCRLDLQADDLDLAAGEYWATLTMLTSEGYSAAVVKIHLEVVGNSDTATGTYDGDGWTTGITVKLGERQQLQVKMSNLPAAGRSAYEMAVDRGFAGSLEDWFASLKGDKGDQGDPGWRETYLLESHENLSDLPADLPVGTIIYRKA